MANQKMNSKNPNPTPNPTKVITGEVRLSYANLWEPKSINGGRAEILGVHHHPQK